MTCRIFEQMRCLVVADLHYSLPQFDWLLSAAAQFDLVIFAGDALDIGSAVDFRAQILVVKKYLSRLSGLTRVILCSGNHDLDERNADGEKIARWIGDVRELGVACDGDSLMIGDTLFTVCPWWDGPRTRDDVDAQLAADAGGLDGRRWIWCPWGERHWVRNLRAARRATIEARRQIEPVTARELDPAERLVFFRDVLRPLAQGMRGGMWFIRTFDGVDLDDPAAAAANRPVFELRPAP